MADTQTPDKETPKPEGPITLPQSGDNPGDDKDS